MNQSRFRKVVFGLILLVGGVAAYGVIETPDTDSGFVGRVLSVVRPEKAMAQRVREFVRSSPHQYRIYIDDMLGEGEGYFDEEPRYHAHDMNCTTWVQSAIAHAYAENEGEVPAVMDHIRYFDGVVGYSTRKHYTDSWLLLDPAPLKRIDLNDCGTPQTRSVVLDFERFKRNNEYTCPLYGEELKAVTVDYLPPEDFLACTRDIEPGVYFVFPVSSERYLEKFGQNGPMALVHGLILDVTEGNEGRQMMIHHASIKRKDVVFEPLDKYIHARASRLFSGYTLWKLDPAWDYRQANLSGDEPNRMSDLLQCETRLVEERNNRDETEALAKKQEAESVPPL